ncbi:hypothetical protein HZB06_00860 [Candidatus Wolfebacteria bacterium]|nr:hypothetical protein [Candidatus Wolfebacteria bacterium]
MKYKRIIGLRGIVALPTILMIGGIIVEIGLAGVLVAYLVSQSGFGVKMSFEAMAAAQAGVNDAVMKIVRNKDFFTGASTTLAVGDRSVEFSAAANTPSAGKSTVFSIGSAFNKKRKLKAILNVNGVTGEVKIESIEEIPL